MIYNDFIPIDQGKIAIGNYFKSATAICCATFNRIGILPNFAQEDLGILVYKRLNAK